MANSRQLKPKDVEELSKRSKAFVEAWKELNVIIDNLAFWSALGVCHVLYNHSLVYLAGVSSALGFYEYEHQFFHSKYVYWGEKHDFYQKKLADLLSLYRELIRNYGAQITYDEDFLKLTKLIINQVSYEDIHPANVKLELSPTFIAILHTSEHKRTIVDKNNQAVPVDPQKAASVESPMTYGMTHRLFSHLPYYNQLGYGLRDRYRPNNEKAEAQPAANGMVDKATSALISLVRRYQSN